MNRRDLTGRANRSDHPISRFRPTDCLVTDNTFKRPMASEEADEATTRKKRVRAAHRGSVTRLLGQVDETLESADARRLKQLKQSLIGKRDVLLTLDDELIELVNEEQLDTEVEQADLIKEKISFAVISIDDALAVLASPPQRTKRKHHVQEQTSPSRSQESSEEEEQTATPLGTSATSESMRMTHAAEVPHSLPTSMPPPPIAGTLTPVTEVPTSLVPRTSFPTISSLRFALPQPTTAVSTLPSLPSTTFSGTPPIIMHGMLSSSLPTAATAHPSTVPSSSLVPLEHQPSPLHVIGPQVKLPKLSIKKFSGDLTKWVTFWDSFNSSIHTNPALSRVDKFNYLVSLLESSAAKAIAGLTLTAANYDEAIATLKKRFGNPQLIVNRHMEALLSVAAVSTHNDVKGLRRLHDSVEAHIRGLRALGVPSGSYGGLLTSVLINKLPPEIRLIVSRTTTGESWDLDQVMKILEQETDARERASLSSAPNTSRTTPPRMPTAATLVASNSESFGTNICVYCNQSHRSISCTTVVDVPARREVLRRTGRCYVCLKKHHLSKDCRSKLRCQKCRGRHHVTICSRHVGPDSSIPTSLGSTQEPSNEIPSGSGTDALSTTSTFCAGAQTPILLQTAKLKLFNPTSRSSNTVARAIMDSGSQRTYITSRLRDELDLPAIMTESLRIKTFGNVVNSECLCDVVQLAVETKDYATLNITALVVPVICNPLTSQPIRHTQESYEHLTGLELADSAGASDTLDVDVLIGSDWYWNLVTGRIIRGRSGPIAIHTKVGWVLSGPTNHQEVTVNLTLTSTHALKIDTCPLEPNLEDHLKRFWELESLGIAKDEASVYDKFVQQIRFDGNRYEVSLPWKEHHPPLPDHLDLCHKRLNSLLKRLRQTPQLLTEYDAIIRDQLDKGMVEIVAKPTLAVSDRVHYLPHHGVVRQDKATSKLRVVYDASARSTGPSLNDCLYTGPKFGQSIFDILLRFRLQRVALTGDIEKAFLMVSVGERDRDSLRFLWATKPHVETPDIITLRFTRVVFGVSSSPFLLNATVNHHLRTYHETDPIFVDKFLSSIYVDDLVSGSNDVKSAYELYMKSKLRLAAAGFKLRKFVTNSEGLRQLIQGDELSSSGRMGEPTHAEEDQSYAKSSLGIKTEERPGISKVLGVQWDVAQDEFLLDIGDVASATEDCEPTKRSVVSISAKFFDPLGIVSPVTILFKMFCQQLCEAKVSWDEPLSGPHLENWNHLLTMLRGAKTITIPRCVYGIVSQPSKSGRLIGFCDASTRAYASVVYMRLESEDCVDVKFLASKTRVTPVGGMTIPRLELLSALLLSKLITSIAAALETEVSIRDPVCYTDSKASLYWIQGTNHEWKQFVENRVTTIRSLVQPQHWRHCPGTENPADIPSRGMSASTLAETPLWLEGPHWLYSKDCPLGELNADPTETSLPDDCRDEMKHKELTHSLVAVEDRRPSLNQLIHLEDYSSSYRLFRVTALVLKFVYLTRSRLNGTQPPSDIRSVITPSDLEQARFLWLKDAQSRLQENRRFPLWRHQLGLFFDESGLWRCRGRMSKSSLSPTAQTPILLDKKHRLTLLLVMDAHKRVIHNGVPETLAELRSAYWLVRGRQFVRKVIHGCTVCRKLEGMHCKGIPPPPLPEFRVHQSRPFQSTGVDFAGPLHVRAADCAETSKVWLCLYTCCTTRAVHLDLVSDLTAVTFMRSFRRFTARRGTPSRMISDNAKTFKSAAVIIKNTLQSSEAMRFFAKLHVEWKFNLEKAPWWGGIFERMIKSAKRCLKKAIGKNCLTHDELLTLVAEVEAVLNCRPLTYVSSEDVEEPLTPSHLLVGYRIMTLPDHSVPDDPDYSPGTFTCRMDHLAKALGRFWRRWKREYLLELREFHRSQAKGGIAYTLERGEVVTVYDEGHPRGLWRLGRIEDLIQSSDGKVRGVYVRVTSKKGHAKILRRPIQHIYPLEVRSSLPPVEPCQDTAEEPAPAVSEDVQRRPVRRAAAQARDRVLGCLMDD